MFAHAESGDYLEPQCCLGEPARCPEKVRCWGDLLGFLVAQAV
jgi:hypothetical protein